MSVLKVEALENKTAMKRELSPCHAGIWPVIKKRVLSLALGAQAVMADVEVVDVVAGKTSGNGIELSSAASNACTHLWIDVKSIFMI